MRKTLLFSLMLSFFSFVAFAQTAAQETPKYISSIEGIKEYSLKNGLQILLIPDASQSNMVVNIVYKVGSRHEGYGETGMAHLLEHMLFKSTKKLGDIKKMLSDKGGNANGTTWYDRTNYYEIFPNSDENLRWSLDMEADRMINATMLQKDLDTEFSVVRNEFEIGENNPQGVLMERVISTAYLWHNYGNSTIGSKEDIERVKADRLRVFYEKYYQPDNAILIVAGKFDEKKALEYISEYFSLIPRPARKLDKTYTVEPPQDGERFVELKRSGDLQVLAAVYHTSPYADKDYAALDLLLEILQADPSGYLYKALIETQKASTVWCWQPNLRDASFAYFNVEVPKDKNLDDAKKSFISELDIIGSRKYTEEDLKRGKSKLLKQIDNITNNTIDFAINMTEIIGAGDYKLWFLYRDAVEKLTTEDINRVAAKYFMPNNRTLGVFIPSGNEDRVKPAEFTDEQISELSSNYKGKKVTEQTATFEANISNIRKNLTEKKLNTGFRYSTLKKPVKGNKVMLSFQAPTGTLKDLSGKTYIGTLMAGQIKSGTKTMTKEQIQDKLDELKSNVNFGWGSQTFTINISTYEEHIAEVMNIVKLCLTEATFPENELSKAKTENKAYYESQMNDPQGLVFSVISQRTSKYPKDHIFYPASFSEMIEGENAVTRQQLVDFYTQFLGGNNVVGTIVGNLQQDQVDKLITSTFGNWKTGAKYTKVLPEYFETKQHSEDINTPDKENGAVAGGISVKMKQDDPDYPKLIMANEMFGAGGFMTSRIPTRLREKEGISYGAGSYMNIPYDNEDGSFGIYAFYNPTLKQKVDAAIKDEFSKALKNGFTKDEFDSSLTSWQNERNTRLGNDNFLASMITGAMKNNYDISEFDKLETKVKALTVEQVNEAFRKYLSLDKLVLIYAGDFNKK